MKFNQTLQTQPGVAAPVAQPNGLAALAGVVEQTVDTVSSLISKDKDAKLAGEVQRIINLQEDLVSQNVGSIKRQERIRQELRNTFADDPQMNLALRKAVGGYGVQSAGDSGGLNETDRRNASIRSMFASISPDLVRQFTDVTDPDGLTMEDMEYVIQQVSAQEQSVREAQEEKRVALQEAAENSTRSLSVFNGAMEKQFEAAVSPSLANFTETLSKLDPNNPEDVAKFNDLRTGVMQSIGLYRNFINSEYATLMTQISVKETRDAAKENRDAYLKILSDFEATYTDPEADLDIIKMQTRFIDLAKSDLRLKNKDAIAFMTVAQDLFGQGMGAFVTEGIINNPNVKLNISQNVSGFLEGFFATINSADENSSYNSPMDFKTKWSTISRTAKGMRGVPNLETATSLYKSFSSAANSASQGILGVKDMEGLLEDYSKFQEFWDLLPESEQDFVMLQRNKIELQMLRDPAEGLIPQAIRNPVYNWNPEQGVFELDVSGIEAVGRAQSEGWTSFVVNQRQAEVDKLNESLNRMVEFTIEQFKAEGRDITPERARGFMGLPSSR